MEKAKNSISFTSDCLQNLLEFIESDTVKEKQWFCGYDIQALKDAQIYLNEYHRIKEIVG